MLWGNDSKGHRVAGLALLVCAVTVAGGGSGWGAELVLRDQAYSGREFDDGVIWVALSVEDGAGGWVTGLGPEAFRLSEALVPAAGDPPAGRVIDVVAQAAEDRDLGFWEKSVGSEAMDLVLVVDTSGSMETEFPALRTELHALVDRLLGQHVDFRVALISCHGSTEELESHPFRGPLELDRLRVDIDSLQLPGESHVPTTTFDGLLEISWFDFRPQAARMVVVITDTLPETVYGTDWTPAATTAATVSAAAEYLRQSGIRLFYSQPAELEHAEWYVEPQINRRAGNEESGFEALERVGLARRLEWPFRQDELPLPESAVTDSTYYFAWRSSLEMPRDPAGQELVVSAALEPPGVASAGASTSIRFPLSQATGDLTLRVRSEAGQALDEVDVGLFHLIGDRPVAHLWNLHPRGGELVVEKLPATRYELLARDDGLWPFSYHGFRYLHRRRLEVPSGNLALEIALSTREEADLLRARGLLRELGGLAALGSPFDGVLAPAGAWLDELEREGVTWEEANSLKRLLVALSGYANVSEYAGHQLAGAERDLAEIVADIGAVVRSAADLRSTLERNWEEALAEGLLDALYAVVTGGGAIELKLAVESALAELVSYIESALVQELKDLVLAQIPAGPYDGTVKDLLDAAVAAEADSAGSETGAMLRKRLLEPYFVEKTTGALGRLVELGTTYRPTTGTRWDWNSELRGDFGDYRASLRSVQDGVWEAFEEQQAIDEWARALSGLVAVLEPLSEALHGVAVFYPTLLDTARAVDDFVEVLDSIQVLPKAIAFGLKVESLNSLGEVAEVAYLEAYPED